jgi:hypothetical protein
MPVPVGHPKKVAVKMTLASVILYRINSVGPVLDPYLIGLIVAIYHIGDAQCSHAGTFAAHVHDYSIM